MLCFTKSFIQDPFDGVYPERSRTGSEPALSLSNGTGFELSTSDFPPPGGPLALFCEIFSVSSARFVFRISCFEFPAEGGLLALFCEIICASSTRVADVPSARTESVSLSIIN